MFVILGLACIPLCAAGVVGWLYYAVRKEEVRMAEINAVPITDPAEINVIYKNNPSSQVVSLLEALAPVSQSAVESAQGNDLKGSVNELHQRGAGPVESAVSGEVSSEDKNKILMLKEDVRNIREKAVAQARDSIDIIKQLRDENQSLRDEMKKFKSNIADAHESGVATQELSEKLIKVSATVALLEKENARLKSGVSFLAPKDIISEDTRSEYQKQMKAFASEIEFLKRDNATLKASQAVQSEKVSAHSFLNAEAVEALKEDISVLQKDRSKLGSRIEELEETAREEREKNSILQYELTKSRAQAVGVERICDNARRKFEGVTREFQATEQDNAQLKKQAGTLEQSLNEFKRLNADLSRRDGVTQVELENNRTQLRDLENIYQVFRDRLENAGVRIHAK